MIVALEFLTFLIYASLIFFIKNYSNLVIVLLINLILMVILRINARKTLLFLLKCSPFILFTGIINILLSNIEYGILISIRLILVCQVTYIFSRKMTPKKMQTAIEKICIPLKIFRINPREIGVMVSISIAFIPILKKELENIKYSLTSKGFKVNFLNIVKNPNAVFLPLITSVIKRTSEIEYSMIAKGYVS